MDGIDRQRRRDGIRPLQERIPPNDK
jgi:hypothetical protein